MQARNKKTVINLGALIAALYDEAAKWTADRRLQKYYVCMALVALQQF